jgi:hypothetical protein
VYAADPAPVPQQARKAPSRKKAAGGWDFQAPDRSAQISRWRESLSATLRRTVFAPSAPAGRFLRQKGAAAGKGLPPVQPNDLHAGNSPENRPFMVGDSAFVHGEFAVERTDWRPYGNDDYSSLAPTLKEEGRVGLYAGFQPDEAVELMFGPEYYLESAVMHPERTGQIKDGDSAFGVGMRLKIGF